MARQKLTDNQYTCLCAADFTKPIYGENPSMMFSQMPGGASCFNIATIRSLEKRGFLKSDGKGGYLLTTEGRSHLMN